MNIVAAVLAFSLFSSLAGKPETVALGVKFDPEAVAWAAKAGNNTIEGTALRRTVGGEAKTCAALPVYLVPDAPYTRARMQAIYGGLERGFNPAFMGKPGKFAEDDLRYTASFRTTACDGQGYFSFEAVPDGDYFLIAIVTWKASPSGSIIDGGMIMQHVHAGGAANNKLILTGY